MKALIAIILLTLTGCTTIGFDTKVRESYSWEPQTDMTICVLVGPKVDNAEQISAHSKAEFSQYNINLDFEYQDWTPPTIGILKAVMQVPLKAPCDRLFAYLHRPILQSLMSLVASIEGEVDNASGSRGYGYVSGLSAAMLMVGSGKKVVAHEFYHLMGCGHSMSKNNCYAKIQEMKHIATDKFVPSWSVVLDKWLYERDGKLR